MAFGLIDKKLIHFLLKIRIKHILWSDNNIELIAKFLILIIILLYASAVGFILGNNEPSLSLVTKIIFQYFNISWFALALFNDFIPNYRELPRSFSKHYPISNITNALLTFLLDFVSIKRFLLLLLPIIISCFLPTNFIKIVIPSCILVLSASFVSFNIRLTILTKKNIRLAVICSIISILFTVVLTLEKSNTHLLVFNLVSIISSLLTFVILICNTQLGIINKEKQTYSTNKFIIKIPLLFKAYLFKCSIPLSISLITKIAFIIVAYMLKSEDLALSNALLSFSLLSTMNIMYVNCNFYGYMSELSINILHRTGLNINLFYVYAKIVIPILLLENTISLLLSAFLEISRMPFMLLLTSNLSLLIAGFVSSLYAGRPVTENPNFTNVQGNVSIGASIFIGLWGCLLYYTKDLFALVLLNLLPFAIFSYILFLFWGKDVSLKNKLLSNIGLG